MSRLIYTCTNHFDEVQSDCVFNPISVKEFGSVVHTHCHRIDVIIALADVKVRLIINYYFYNCIIIVIGPAKEILIHVQVLIASASNHGRLMRVCAETSHLAHT